MGITFFVYRSARFCICTAEPGEFVGQWNPPNFRGNVAKFHGTVQEKALDRSVLSRLCLKNRLNFVHRYCEGGIFRIMILLGWIPTILLSSSALSVLKTSGQWMKIAAQEATCTCSWSW